MAVITFSIITPSYNQAIYLERTMRSVLEQQGDFQLEYIVVDGGSTDGSEKIIQRFAQHDERIKVICEPDKGQSDAINKGLRLATGQIVAFLNSDDVYDPGALQAVATALARYPQADWLYGRCHIINEHDKIIRWPITLYKNILGWRYSYAKLLVVNFINQPATFWRKTALEKIGLIDDQEHMVMDYDYWCRLGAHGKPIVLHQYLADFRFYPTSKSGQHFQQQFQDELRIAQKYSTNPIIIALHRFHNFFIITCYRLLS